MKRSTIFFWISLLVLFSLVAVPSVVLAQEGGGEVEVGEPGEGEDPEVEVEVEVEPGEGEGGEGEAPEYLPTTGGATQATTSMIVLAILGLLFAGAFLTRAFQRSA